ncbi:hypothetical protein EMCRGX_G004871 [Ephydatia muelleri]
MATKEEFLQLKSTVQELRRTQLDILIRLENLEQQLTSLGGGSLVPKEPEAVLTCVQCGAEYKESENAAGLCKYHGGKLKPAGSWNYQYDCCKKGDRNYESSKRIPGCAKGKHSSKHHTDYPYESYFAYMEELSKKAQEVWMELDVKDHITDHCMWTEVGLTEDGRIYILAGTCRSECTAVVAYTPEELKHCQSPQWTALEKTGSTGWNLKVELKSNNSVATSVRVSLAPSSSPTSPMVKELELCAEGDVFRAGHVACLSDPSIVMGDTSGYTLPANTYTGPQLVPGEDFSKGRKNDYEGVVTDNCPLKLQQHGHTKASSSYADSEGNWNNWFTATLKLTNTDNSPIAVTDVFGEYRSHEGQWIRCHATSIGQYRDISNFSLDPASTISLDVKLAIRFGDKAPATHALGYRAHPSLPQPLHLRATFVDHKTRTSSVEFEQGNPPLDLPTKESREKAWCEGKLLYHVFCDDTDKLLRNDATIFYDEKGVMCYRPSLEDDSSSYYYLSSSVLPHLVYLAMQAHVEEYPIEDMKKEGKGSSIIPYLMVDLGKQRPYAIKVVINTSSSSAIGYFRLPCYDMKSSTISLEPQKVMVGCELQIRWSVPVTSEKDWIGVYTCHGKSSLTYEYNKHSETSGSLKVNAPLSPGWYEARYYPAWLESGYTGYRHDQYVAVATFEVTHA